MRKPLKQSRPSPPDRAAAGANRKAAVNPAAINLSSPRQRQSRFKLVTGYITRAHHDDIDSDLVKRYRQLAETPFNEAVEEIAKWSLEQLEPGIYRVITNAWVKVSKNSSLFYFTAEVERAQIPVTQQRGQSKKRARN